ncbi:MFS transporter (plasmid) [Iamia sp. SCSIO 61187]|uniref:MFS transporter n=1 Tax=Iamia sp. SCSIO 61187 TaxID=2722752 RepID=UPI001C636C32|nr:MFS transporter [Iamia sp. SCSIO 61187]QYG94328.1 MFS transporter [Iamia sp. SCSIO 61187]QYG95780.1 MFS transporter [Iamia sp. SCSIO 61187]
MSRPAFRRFWAAQTVSRWGDTFNSVALVIVVYELTGSGVKVAGTVALEIAPVILFGFIAGSFVDRYDRRRIMVSADVARALVAIGLAVFHDELLAVYLAAFALSAFTVLFNPAAGSALPAVVVDPDDIVGANAAVWSAAVISQIALAPVAGLIVATAGARIAFLLNALTFVISAVLLVRLPMVREPVRSAGKHLADIAEGLKAIRSSRFLGVLACVQGLAALSAGATSALLVVLAEDHLDVRASQFGLLIAAIGVGAGVGPLVLQRIAKDVRRRGWLFGPYVLRGVVDVVLAASTSFGVALGALAAYGVGTSTGNVTYNSVLQTTVPERMRGRVFAFFDVVWQTGRLLSIGVGGLAADRFGIAAVYLLGGALLVGAGALGLTLAPQRLVHAANVGDADSRMAGEHG